MSKKDKLLRKIRNNPKAVSFKDLSKLLDYFEFSHHLPKTGSHHKFSRMINGRFVKYPIPSNKKQVKRVLEYIEEIIESEKE